MSESVTKMQEEFRSLVGEQKSVFEEYKKENDKAIEQGQKNSEALAKMDEKFDTIQDGMNKIEKAQKLAVVKAEIADDAQRNYKQCLDFLKGIKLVGKGKETHFNSNDMEYAKSFIANQKAQFNELDDSAGGATIMPFMDSTIDKLVREYSNFASIVSMSTIDTDSWERLIRKESNGALWGDQIDNFDDATKKDKFGKVKIMVNDLHAIVPFTDNLEMDSVINIVTEILESASEDFAISIAQEGINGTSTNRMQGILSVDESAGDEFGKIQRITTGSAGSIAFDDLYNLIYSIKTRYMTNSVMYGNRLTHRVVRKLKDNEGQYLWQPNNQVGQPANVAGVPFLEMPELVKPDASDVYQTGEQAIMYGDLKAGYRMVSRMGIRTLRDNLTQYPDVVYKMKRRVGGGLLKGEAIKILKVQ